jgi:hypothetical protein
MEEGVVFLEPTEHLPDNFMMMGEVRMRDEDVIEIDHDVSRQDEVWKVSFIIIWKVAGELVRLAYITSGSKSSQLVWNLAFHLSPSQIQMLLNPHQTLSFVKNQAPFKQLMRSLIKGSRYWFFTVIALSTW